MYVVKIVDVDLESSFLTILWNVAMKNPLISSVGMTRKHLTAEKKSELRNSIFACTANMYLIILFEIQSRLVVS